MTALAVGEYLQHRRLALERQLAWKGQRLLNRILLRPVRGLSSTTCLSSTLFPEGLVAPNQALADGHHIPWVPNSPSYVMD
jgi:hypothetical protein